MIYKPKGRRYYRVKFRFQGKMIHECTRATDKKTARSIEAKIRTELAEGNFGILQVKPAPTLAEFLKDDFLPFVKTKFESTKQKTYEYYSFGAKRLLDSGLNRLRLDEITDQHAAQFAAHYSELAVSTINCGLRTLRRALNLAYQWGKLNRAPHVTLAKGERQRERIVTEEEFLAYRELCRQPWRDVATVLFGTGMRPGEAYELRWEHVLLNGRRSMIQIADGKTKAARRLLPMVPEVYRVLSERHEAQNKPSEGWVFPSGSESGHLEESTAKIQHGDALRKLQAARDAYDKWEKEGQTGSWVTSVADSTKLAKEYISRHSEALKAGVKPFEPYCLRHSALTRLAESGCDAFTLARIAGHSSITITQRYCHPQADAIERAFTKMASEKKVVTDAGNRRKLPPAKRLGGQTVKRSA
jgi:integrase